MKKSVLLVFIVSYTLIFTREFKNNKELNEIFYKKKNESESTKVTIKVVPYLNLIIKKDGDKVLEKVEIKGSAAKDTQIKIEEERVKIVAICDNYKW
ncbi:MAG: hypothetical protein ACRC4T_22420 [Cetobacterium sp.]